MGIVQFSACAYYGASQGSDYGKADLIVRDTNTHSLSLGQHYLRHKFGSFQDKGIGPGEQPLHGLIGIIGDLGIAAYLLQTIAYDREGLFEWPVFQLVNKLDPFFIIKVTTYPVKGVRGIGDQFPFIQGFAYLVYQALLRIL